MLERPGDPHPRLRVDRERLWSRLTEMARIGATEAGGVHRLALTDQDRAARDLFSTWCREADLRVAVDALGNLFARRDGTDAEAEPVLLHSHLDSQPLGGRYDGALGVLAALEVAETLNDHSIGTRHPIEVVSWTNEEGSRFAPAMVASGVFAGVFELEWALAIEDASGRTLGSELDRIGYAGARPAGGWRPHAALELHIEQGPILERADTPIGVVTGVQGARWYDVEVAGEVTHAGPFPMSARRDPVRGTARLLDRLFTEVIEHDPDGRVTVGSLRVVPGSRNTMPGAVHLTVDLRHPDDDALTELDAVLRRLVDDVASELGLEARLEQIWHSPTVRFAAACVEAVRAAAEGLGYRSMDVFSGAGHDSVYLSRVCPTGMIFVPCEGGVSHAEHERITLEDAGAGADVLLHAALRLAGAA